MTERRARQDLDFDYPLDDLDDNDGWYGQAQVADPNPTREVDDLGRDDSHNYGWDDPDDTDRWYVPAEAADPTSTRDVDDLRRDDSHDDWRDDADETPWRSLYAPRDARNGTPGIGDWTFTLSRPRPWYRSKKHVMTALIAAAVAAIAVSGILLVLRNPATGGEESTTVSPKVSTSAQPAPTSAAPALSTALPPPPPAPPPTSAAQVDTAPVITRPDTQPRQNPPAQTDKPEIGVTRTPATRVPISATPPPPPKRETNSATPGDAPKNGGGWGW